MGVSFEGRTTRLSCGVPTFGLEEAAEDCWIEAMILRGQVASPYASASASSTTSESENETVTLSLRNLWSSSLLIHLIWDSPKNFKWASPRDEQLAVGQ